MVVALSLYGCGKSGNESDEELSKDILIEVIFFDFTPDTGNNSQRWRYEIKFINPNDRGIKGRYEMTTREDGLIKYHFPSTPLSPCIEIDANSECTISFDQEEAFEQGGVSVQSIELVSMEYIIIE